MNRRRFLLLALAGAARGTAAASQSGVDYPRVEAGTEPRFPRDHGSHSDFRTEWWYATGWLDDAKGNRYGMQVTFFRNRPRVAEDNPSAFAARQLVFAHAAIADPARGLLRHDQRAAREGLGLAGAETSTTHAWIGDWSIALEGDTYAAKVVAREFAFDLRFVPTQPPLLHGERGVSRKGPLAEQASWYYSLPQLAVSGTLELDGGRREVKGRAWLDHEWSSEYLAPEASGWDWTGINLDDGGALMAFRMRDKAGGVLWSGGTLRAAGGRVRVFRPQEIAFAPLRTWRSPRTNVAYPVEMSVDVGGSTYTLVPLFDDQELDARATTGTLYWEGAVRARAADRDVGRGYLELTGYGSALKL